MLAFLTAFLMGAVFIVLLKFLLRALNEENKKQIRIFLLSLFILCAVFAAVAISNLWYITYFFCGFLSGTALTAVGVYIYKNIFKKLYGSDINLDFLKKRINGLLKNKKCK